jgi:hypothetical protein
MKAGWRDEKAEGNGESEEIPENLERIPIDDEPDLWI